MNDSQDKGESFPVLRAQGRSLDITDLEWRGKDATVYEGGESGKDRALKRAIEMLTSYSDTILSLERAKSDLDVLATVARTGYPPPDGHEWTDEIYRKTAACIVDVYAKLPSPHNKGARMDNDLIFTALVELGHRIERCGASPELTNAVSLCSDLRRAIGNQHNQADAHAEQMVRDALPKQA